MDTTSTVKLIRLAIWIGFAIAFMVHYAVTVKAFNYCLADDYVLRTDRTYLLNEGSHVVGNRPHAPD